LISGNSAAKGRQIKGRDANKGQGIKRKNEESGRRGRIGCSRAYR